MKNELSPLAEELANMKNSLAVRSMQLKESQEKCLQLQNCVDELKARAAALSADLGKAQGLLCEARAEAENWHGQYDVISNSTCWKLTKPIRCVLDCAKAWFRKAGR